MDHVILTRRHLVAALIIASLCAMSTAICVPSASAATRSSTIRPTVCPYDWASGTWKLKQLIRCAARRWRVVGGPDKAIAVARCESRFRPRARNPAGYAGVFQQSTRYWPARSRTFGFRHWSVYNGRANILVSIRMAHRSGWRAWSCA